MTFLLLELFQLDADKYENDPELEKIRRERNYSWMDIITICKEKLPDYEEKVGSTRLFETTSIHRVNSLCDRVPVCARLVT